MFHIIHHQENINESHSEIPLHLYQKGKNYKHTIPSADEDVGHLELSHVAHGIIHWHNHFWKLAVSVKTKYPYSPSHNNFTSGYLLNKPNHLVHQKSYVRIHQKSYVRIFIAASFIVAPNGNNQMSINRRRDKWIEWGIVTQWNTLHGITSYNNMNG